MHLLIIVLTHYFLLHTVTLVIIHLLNIRDELILIYKIRIL